MKRFLLLVLVSSMACDTGELTFVADLPRSMAEVSGIEISAEGESLWMINDGGNKARLVRVGLDGKIKHEIKIDARNRDWEDLTSDPDGNIYIGDFGNNSNDRHNLAILKVRQEYLESFAETPVEVISFSYPDQTEFPPKKSEWHYDSESFLYYKNNFYVFTKSRTRKNFGKTNLYRIPAIPGKHQAQFLGSFTTCDKLDCWVTAADISDDGTKVALLTHQSVWIFSDFQEDRFLDGKAIEFPFEHLSQKESICFKNDSTLYIADEQSHGAGGNLYTFELN